MKQKVPKRAGRLKKIALLLCCFSSIALSLSAQTGQTLTLQKNSVKIAEVFTEIRKQTGLIAMYDNLLLNAEATINVNFHNTPVSQAMDQLLQGRELTWSISGKNILIQKKSAVSGNGLSAGSVSEQEPITGRVLSDSNQPLQGATVRVAKTNITTFTNRDGRFTLRNAPEEASLSISYVGYETLGVKASDDLSALRLTTSASNLDEVVVNKGYYTTTKELNTGDVTTIKAADIAKQPIGDPTAALQGRVAGLQITQNSGVTGRGYTVLLRGKNSIQNTSLPLYIIDGVPFYTGTTLDVGIAGNSGGFGSSPLNSLNPADISTIDVLKDADATAIYGSRGANGVFLITTKRGAAGKLKFDFNVYTGNASVERLPELLNTQQYLQMRHEAFNNDGKLPGTTDYDLNGKWDSTRYTNWPKLLIGGTAHYTDAQASVSGGNTNTQFLISAGYHKETTVFPGDFSDQKGSVHINLSHTSTDQKFKLTSSTFYSVDKNYLPITDLAGQILAAPNAPAIYDSLGWLNWQNGTWTNPYSYLKQVGTTTTNYLNSNLTLSYELLKGLQLKGNFGYTTTVLNSSFLYPKASFNPAQTNQQSFSNFGFNNLNGWVIEPQLNYRKAISKGQLEALAGGSFLQQTQNSNSYSGTGYSSDELLNNPLAATTKTISSIAYSLYRYAALMGRISYNWDSKYLVNLTARRDGSSRYGPGKQFANFGAVGAAWIFTNEGFVKRNASFLSFGKLRASYGSSGNDQIGDYSYLTTYSPITNVSYLGVAGLAPVRIANPYYAWEVTRKLEGGIDLGFMQDKLLFSANYYRNKSSNQLVRYPLSAVTGATSIVANLPATVQNSGWEFTFNSTNINSKNFVWTTSINLTIPKNKLLSFPGIESSSYATQYAVGQPLSIKYLYHSIGINPQSGIYTYQDYDKDGLISNPNDLKSIVFIGQQFYGGLQNNIKLYGFELDFLFQFVKQNNGLNTPMLQGSGMPGSGISNQTEYLFEHAWHKPGDNAVLQKFGTSSNAPLVSAFNSRLQSDGIYTDASFIRLKNVSISYELPAKWKQAIHFQNARIYLQGQNLLTITKYVGYDPENQTSKLPPLRVLTAGLQLSF